MRPRGWKMRTHGAGGGSTAAKRKGTTSTAVAPEANSSIPIAVVGWTPRQEANQTTRARPGSGRARKDSAATLQQADNGAATTQDPDAPPPPPGSYTADRSCRPAPAQIWPERAPPPSSASNGRAPRLRPPTSAANQPAAAAARAEPGDARLKRRGERGWGRALGRTDGQRGRPPAGDRRGRARSFLVAREKNSRARSGHRGGNRRIG